MADHQITKHAAIVQTIHGTFDKHLYLDNWWVLDVVCATVLGSYIQAGRPIWLAIVGPPGSAKTVIIESLRGLPGVTGIGGFTPHTFASGMIQRTKNPPKVGILAKLSDRVEDLVHYSDGTKFFAFNDFSTLFAMPSNIKNELLSQMRQVYDGHFEWEWGTGKKFDWYGRVGALVASTEEWDSQMNLFQRMGERFLLWREYRQNGTKHLLRAMRQVDSVMKSELEGAMALLDQFEIPNDVDTSVSQDWLSDLAEATAIARTPITRDHFSKDVLDSARPESAARLAKQLDQLMKGLMLFRDSTSTHSFVRYPIMRAAIGSLPQIRLEVLGSLEESGATSDELAAILHTNRSVIRRTCEDLLMLGVIAKQSDSAKLVPHPKMAQFCAQARELWMRIKPKEEDEGDQPDEVQETP